MLCDIFLTMDGKKKIKLIFFIQTLVSQEQTKNFNLNKIVFVTENTSSILMHPVGPVQSGILSIVKWIHSTVPTRTGPLPL